MCCWIKFVSRKERDWIGCSVCPAYSKWCENIEFSPHSQYDSIYNLLFYIEFYRKCNFQIELVVVELNRFNSKKIISQQDMTIITFYYTEYVCNDTFMYPILELSLLLWDCGYKFRQKPISNEYNSNRQFEQRNVFCEYMPIGIPFCCNAYVSSPSSYYLLVDIIVIVYFDDLNDLVQMNVRWVYCVAILFFACTFQSYKSKTHSYSSLYLWFLFLKHSQIGSIVAHKLCELCDKK